MIFSLTLAAILLISNSNIATAQIADKIDMMKAQKKFNEKDYYGALRVYRELYDKTPNDAQLNYKMGLTYLELKNLDEALTHLKAAEKTNKEIDRELYLNIGKAYNRMGKLDSAMMAYEEYQQIEKLPDFYKQEVSELIQMVNNAKEFMANPVDVKIKNMDVAINSKYDDYHPSFTADGKLMVFTSRRGDVKGEFRDPVDQQYFEDVYISFYNDTTNEWVRALPAPGAINSEGHDANLSISPDGSVMFVFVNDGKNYGDIYYSKKGSTERWSRPRSMEKPINSTYWDSYASQAPDGNTLYFCSDRAKDGLKSIGYGNADIYVSKKIGRKEWGKPENLGPVINDENDQTSVFIHPDGKTLFFSSTGPKGMGGIDIFMSKMKEDGTWSEPKNLGYPINSIGDDKDFTLSTDGKKAWFCSIRKDGFGLFDIYEVDLSNYDLLDEGKTPEQKANLSILKGTIRSSVDASKLEATVKIKDAEGNMVNSTDSDEEGNYFITLKGDQEYIIEVEEEGYQKFTQKVKLQKGEKDVFTLIRPITLNKQPEEQD